MAQARRSAQYILKNADTVTINETALTELAEKLRSMDIDAWDKFDFHYNGPNVIDYVFALDAVNFCFWPCPGFEYEHMASNLKTLMSADAGACAPASLVAITEEQVQQIFQPGFPLLDERVRLLREIGQVAVDQFGGSFEAVVQSAQGSAQRLVDILTAHFPGFRDSAIYKRRQVFFYKRA